MVLPQSDSTVAYVGGGDGSMVLDHEIVFVRSPNLDTILG